MCHFHSVAIIAANHLHHSHMYLHQQFYIQKSKEWMEMDQIGSIAHPSKRNPGTPGQNTVHRSPMTLQREQI